MDYDALRLFAFAGDHRALGAGEVLFEEGDKSDGGFVVMRGAIVVAPKDGHAPRQAARAPDQRGPTRPRMLYVATGAAPAFLPLLVPGAEPQSRIGLTSRNRRAYARGRH
jgi:hypothetical protein